MKPAFRSKTKSSCQSMTVVSQNKWRRPRPHDIAYLLSIKTSGKDQELMTESILCQSKQVAKTKS